MTLRGTAGWLAILLFTASLAGCIEVTTNSTASPNDTLPGKEAESTSPDDEEEHEPHEAKGADQNGTASSEDPKEQGSSDTSKQETTAKTSRDAGPVWASEEQLWHDPQTDSHPAYNYPTFTTVPTDHPNLPSRWAPIPNANASLDRIDLQHVAEDPNQTVTYGTGIAIFGELVIVPGRTDGMTWIVNIEDPEAPEIVSTIPVPGRDADTIAFPDGRLYAVFATGSGVVPVWNLTNPHNPSKAAQIIPERGSHNVAIVPGTPLLYNAASKGGGLGSQLTGTGNSGTAIYDLSDPQNPAFVQDFNNGYSCHDITFGIRDEIDEYRAYCAGIEMTQIWDIETPTNPSVIASVPAFHGNPNLPATAFSPASLSHYAGASTDGEILIVGDETGGGAAPACDAHASQGPMTLTGPAGNLYFYDARDESNPELVGMISPNVPIGTSCTAHFGRLIPAGDRDVIAMAFYSQGVNVIEFTDPANPTILDQWNQGTHTWDVWYYQGYLVTGDTSRGMDLLRVSS